jgi:hypothetical protein
MLIRLKERLKENKRSKTEDLRKTIIEQTSIEMFIR